MYQFIQKHIDLRLAKLCLILAGLYNLFFNSVILLNNASGGVHSFSKIIPDIFCLTLILFTLFWGLAVHRTLFFICTLLLFLSGALASYHIFFFNIYPTLPVIKNFWGLGLDEIYQALDIRLIAWLVFSGFICIYTMKQIGAIETGLFFSKLLSAFCLVLTINAVLSPSYKIMTAYLPGQFLHNSYLTLSNKFSK